MAESSSPPPQRMVLLPFLVASLLASLAATFHSTQVIDPWYEQQGREQPIGYSSSSSSSSSSVAQPPVPLRLRERPRFRRNQFTFDTFRVGGVELASFGLEDTDGSESSETETKTETETRNSRATKATQQSSTFELFQDFDLSSQIIGNETWVDLIGYRRDAEFTSLSFYVDKVARKRWLKTTTALEGMEAFVLKYGSELLGAGKENEIEIENEIDNEMNNENASDRRREAQRRALRALLPIGTDYAAKPTHLSCAGGVWLTKTVGSDTFVGNGKKPFKKVPGFTTDLVASDLAKQLQVVQESCGRRVPESLALRHVRPGIVVEERFTTTSSKSTARGGDDENENNKDDRGGMEFKVFTIWGRMWLAVQRPGMDGAVAILHRNGTNLEWSGKSHPLPDWIDWPRIVAIAEESGRNKDMFRTDIFVGIPAGADDDNNNDNNDNNDNNNNNDHRDTEVRYVISESEIHPTEYFHVKGTQEIFDEGGRLWLAGYASGNYRVVPNTEVPPAFVRLGMLPEDPALWWHSE